MGWVGLVLSLALACGSPLALVDEQGDFILTEKGGEPALTTNWAVWTDPLVGDRAIRAHDFRTGEQRRLSDPRFASGDPAVHGRYAAWIEVPAKGQKHVRVYDLESEQSLFGSEDSPSGDPIRDVTVALSNTAAVWERRLPATLDVDVYAYFIKSNRVERLSHTGRDTFDFKPDVSDRYAVWIRVAHDSLDGSLLSSDLLARRLPDGPEIIVSEPGKLVDNPTISGAQVIWAQADTVRGQVDLWLADLDTGERHRLTNTPWREFTPDISGRWVVWHDDRYGDPDIFVLDLWSGRQRAVARKEGIEDQPAVSATQVVWRSLTDGFVIRGTVLPR